MKHLFTDNGGEYVNQTVHDFLAGRGIVYDHAPVYGHEYNGIAERFNRTLLTMVPMLLLQITDAGDIDEHSNVEHSNIDIGDSGNQEDIQDDTDILDTIHVQPSTATTALSISYNLPCTHSHIRSYTQSCIQPCTQSCIQP